MGRSQTKSRRTSKEVDCDYLMSIFGDRHNRHCIALAYPDLCKLIALRY